MTAIDSEAQQVLKHFREYKVPDREYRSSSGGKGKGVVETSTKHRKSSSSSKKKRADQQLKQRSSRRRSSGTRVSPDRRNPGMVSRKSGTAAENGKGTRVSSNGNGEETRRRKSKNNRGLKINTSSNGVNNGGGADSYPATPDTVASTPGAAPTPAATRRGSKDLRSPGITKTPAAAANGSTPKIASPDDPLPDLITQTDRFGNAATPRSEAAIETARNLHPSGPKPALHVDSKGQLVEDTDKYDSDSTDGDACDSILDSLRLMCCCLLPEQSSACATSTTNKDGTDPKQQQLKDNVSAAGSADKVERVRLLGELHPDDTGKKCLVLDLDETLVHSSFRAVPGADFVIPVQIEDVVHFVYVAKRPGVDEFLTEMAKHYEIVVYTASLNKYADPLLDLLDPNRVIRARLFRESCVYYEGNYVKDLSLLDRDLTQAIIVDNSPSSYIFHPENAIDCSSFIDDPKDRELDQMAAFLKGIKDIKDVRHICQHWRDWPNVDISHVQ